MSESETKTNQGISRRSLAAGVAWTAPAIWMASAAPAVAASMYLKEAWVGAQYSCNNGKWTMFFEMTNTATLKLKVTGVVITNGTLTWTSTKGKNLPVQVAPTAWDDGYNPWKDASNNDVLQSKWGASPAFDDALHSGYATTGTCAVANNPDCACTNGTSCIGPCLILAKDGPFTVTFTLEIDGGTPFTVVLPNAYPKECGVNHFAGCNNFV